MSSTPIPYGRQWIDEADIAAVVEALRSDWLTTGPRVAEFEQAFARFTGSVHAVAVSSGTAALHAIMHAAGIGPGDEVIVPAMTFAASANCVVYQGGRPVFADVKPDTLLLDPDSVISNITARTRAIVAVDYAGHACDYDTSAPNRQRPKPPSRGGCLPLSGRQLQGTAGWKPGSHECLQPASGEADYYGRRRNDHHRRS